MRRLKVNTNQVASDAKHGIPDTKIIKLIKACLGKHEITLPFFSLSSLSSPLSEQKNPIS